jgi:hypothetical protein
VSLAAGSGAQVNAVTGFTATTSGLNGEMIATVSSNAGSAASVKVTGDLGTSSVITLPPTLAGQYVAYGNVVQGADLANTDDQAQDMLAFGVIFPSSFTGKTVSNVRFYIQTGSSSSTNHYSQGNCGTFDVAMMLDSSGVPSTTSLGTTTGVSVVDTSGCANSPGSGPAVFQNVTLSPQITNIQGNTKYWIAVRNSTASATNWMSINSIYLGGGSFTNFQSNALFDTTNLLVYRCNAASFAACTSWAVRANFLAIVDVTFSDGTHWGNGYINNGGHSGVSPLVVNGTSAGGELFTVSGSQNMNFSSIGVYAQLASGSGALTATLKDLTAGTTVTSGSVTLPLFTTRDCEGGSSFPACNQQYGSIPASGQLQAGHQYRLIFTTTAGTVYNFYVSENGTRNADPGGRTFNASTGFADGNSQSCASSCLTTGTWSNFNYDTTVTNGSDITFFFGISG